MFQSLQSSLASLQEAFSSAAAEGEQPDGDSAAGRPEARGRGGLGPPRSVPPPEVAGGQISRGQPGISFCGCGCDVRVVGRGEGVDGDRVVHFDVAGHALCASWRRGLFFRHYTAAKDVDARGATGWGVAAHVRAELEGSRRQERRG
jgi:hypothetical protein